MWPQGISGSSMTTAEVEQYTFKEYMLYPGAYILADVTWFSDPIVSVSTHASSSVATFTHSN